ncbi:hypothetical protein P7C70_g4667, partial [Phenoliferia sp. Uapishka_3]
MASGTRRAPRSLEYMALISKEQRKEDGTFEPKYLGPDADSLAVLRPTPAQLQEARSKAGNVKAPKKATVTKKTALKVDKATPVTKAKAKTTSKKSGPLAVAVRRANGKASPQRPRSGPGKTRVLLLSAMSSHLFMPCFPAASVRSRTRLPLTGPLYCLVPRRLHSELPTPARRSNDDNEAEASDSGGDPLEESEESESDTEPGFVPVPPKKASRDESGSSSEEEEAPDKDEDSDFADDDPAPSDGEPEEEEEIVAEEEEEAASETEPSPRARPKHKICPPVEVGSDADDEETLPARQPTKASNMPFVNTFEGDLPRQGPSTKVAATPYIKPEGGVGSGSSGQFVALDMSLGEKTAYKGMVRVCRVRLIRMGKPWAAAPDLLAIVAEVLDNARRNGKPIDWHSGIQQSCYQNAKSFVSRCGVQFKERVYKRYRFEGEYVNGRLEWNLKERAAAQEALEKCENLRADGRADSTGDEFLFLGSLLHSSAVCLLGHSPNGSLRIPPLDLEPEGRTECVEFGFGLLGMAYAGIIHALDVVKKGKGSIEFSEEYQKDCLLVVQMGATLSWSVQDVIMRKLWKAGTYWDSNAGEWTAGRGVDLAL